MKNLYFALFLWLLSTPLAYGQFSVQAEVSYGFAPPNQQVGRTVTRTAGLTSVGNIYGSHGQGLQSGLRLGYYWGALQGVEMGIHYHQSGLQTSSQVDTAYRETIDRTTRQFLLTPSLVLGRVDAGLHPFVKVGLLIPVGTRLEEERKGVNDQTRFGGGLRELVQSYEYELRTSLGATASLGVRYRSERFFVTAEAYWQLLDRVPVRRTTTSLILNGEDYLDQVPVLLLEREYQDEIDTSMNGVGPNSDPDQPAFERRFTLPYSTLGLRVGVGMMIGR